MKHNRGFTIIELSMAILFISFLILAVAFVSINIGNMYQKGTTLKTVNQSGREVVDTLRRDIMQSDGSIEVVDQANIIRWCLGTVSFIANKANLINENDSTTTFNASDGRTPYRLVRVSDRSRSLCASPYPMLLSSSSDAVDLLSSSVPALAVYDMKLSRMAGSSRQSLYEVSLLIGTAEDGIVDSSSHCLPNSDPSANANYCSVVEFKTIIRSGGGQ